MNPAEIKNSVSVSEIVGKYIELKPKGHDKWGCCPFHGERTPSFLVQDARRSWHCYGCGTHGDVIDFVQKIENCDIGRACDLISGGEGYTKREYKLPPIVDIYAGLELVDPKETSEQDLPRLNGEYFRAWNPKSTDQYPNGRWVNYKPSLVHPYRLSDYTIVGMTVRINMPDRKIVPMMRRIWKDGHREWAHYPFAAPRSLYGLETIKSNDASPILVLEGEKCADIARRVLYGTCVTWSGGTNAAKFTDWSPLKGRKVLLWPDADPEGISAMLGKTSADGKKEPGIEEFARKAGALDVKILMPEKTREKGWDIGDAVRQRMTREDIVQWMRDRIQTIREAVI